MKSQSRFTDIFISRPVLATVISLLIFITGMVSMFVMPLQQYPTMENTTITVTASYPGASASDVQGYVTTPLEASIGSANGIDYMTSSSVMGQATITAYIKLNYDPNAAMTDVTGKVNAVLSQLPSGVLSPTITKSTGQTFPDVIIGFNSDTLSPEQITAYITNVYTPKVEALGGISQVLAMGAQPYAMRIWLDSYRMAKLGVTPTQVMTALQNNNVQAQAGQLKSDYLYVPVQANTNVHMPDEFNNLVVANVNGNIVRIKDIGHAELGSESYDSQVFYDGKPAVFAGIFVADGANPLSVVDTVVKSLPAMQVAFPAGLHSEVVYNSTDFIQASIDEVITSIAEAGIIVIIVIFLFLGALRSVFIPVITIPLSLVGVGFLMMAMGFSLNLLTLLAMVLAIGLVVDDAIVVLENIYRHLEEGKTPFDAAIIGAREIASPVIVMTTTLAAVFAPIGFLGGMTGALFKEFAFTLAGAVIISGIVALTFSPMLCSKIINHKVLEGKFVKKIDTLFEKVKVWYHRRLLAVLDYRPIVLLVAAVVLSSCAFFFLETKQELAPFEDQGFIMVFGNAPTPANLNYLNKYNAQLDNILKASPGEMSTFIVDGYPNDNNILAGTVYKPWGNRSETTMAILPQLQKQLSAVPGIQLYSALNPPLPGPQGMPVMFVITGTDSQAQIYNHAQTLINDAYNSGLFIFLNTDVLFNQPQTLVNIDRDKAALLGVNMSDIGNALSVMMSDAQANYFTLGGYSYQVIPQVYDSLRQRDAQLNQFYVKSQISGQMLPLSTFVSFGQNVQPSTLNQFNQLNSVTIQGMLSPGVTIGQGLSYMTSTAKQVLPKSMNVNYAQQSRQYIQEGDSMIYAFMFALIIIYLVLAAQFESFRDPIIVLVSVPMSICGALIPLYLGVATINIYSEVGLITLIGLISKHGILMVEFANKLQEQGKSIHEAIVEAAATRLRPILMTTFAMVFGVVPLVIATGAGAVSRFNVGLVIACGMTIGTCFTLFVVPTMYTYIAKKHDHIADTSEIG